MEGGARMRNAVLVIALGLGVATAQNDLVGNPGFEDLAEGGKQLAAWGLPTRPGVQFAWDDEVYRSGRRSARVDGIDPDKQTHYVQAWRQNVRPLPDEPLWLSVWVKTRDVISGRLNVLHQDDKGEVLLNQGLAGFDGTFDWRELGGALKRVPGATGLQLVMGLVKSTGTVWFDDLALEPAGDLSRRLGRATMTPAEPPVAGSAVPVSIEITLGDRGLETGGSLQLRWENWRSAREFRFKDFTVACAGQDAAFEVTVPPRKKTWPPTPKPTACIATLKAGGPLAAGAKVAISADLTYTPHTNVSCTLTVLVASAEGAAPRPLEEQFTLRSKGGPAARLSCTARARPLAGEPCRVTVALTDEHGNPAQDFRGAVRLTCNTDAGLPSEYAFTEADTGSHDFEGRFPEGAVSRVTVTSGEMTATSNPILPRGADEPAIFFGDIHSHCEVSADGVGDPDLAYDYARRFMGLDFAALSDHSPRAARWQRILDIGNRRNDPDRFVTLLAFEWSDSVRGHRNAYYRGDTGPEHPPGVRDNMESWWAFFDEQDIPVLTIPHHPNTESAAKRPDGKSVWGPVDWSQINHKYQRNVELCQNRGSFEAPGGPLPELRIVRKDCGSSVQTALAKGHRLGFIGSTDTHSGRPGTGPARAAVIATEFSRAGIWDALHARRCYATSGKHILVLFTVNDEPMGSEITLADADAPRNIAWRAIGTGPIKRVDLLRNNEVTKSWEGTGQDDLSGELAYAERLAEAEWWYVRAIQEDTEMAWSSPVWLDPPR